MATTAGLNYDMNEMYSYLDDLKEQGNEVKDGILYLCIVFGISIHEAREVFYSWSQLQED